MMFCPKCGNPTEDSARLCSKCGATLAPVAQSLSKAGASRTPDATDFYRAIIGLKNQDYYLRHFSRFDANGKAGISWHWPALFTTFFWLLYRKMWLNAVLYWLMPFIAFIPIAILAAVFDKSGGYLIITYAYFLYLTGIFILPPMYANALYYKHCQKKITESRSSSNDVQWQLGELSGKGGTSNAALIFIIIIFLVGLAGILAAIAIPQYVTFKNRATVAQAAHTGRSATAHVANYYYQNKQIPLSIEESGFKDPLPNTIKKISLDSQTGNITITMTASSLDGKSIQFIPVLNTDNQITWKCVSNDIQEQYLPRECRTSETK